MKPRILVVGSAYTDFIIKTDRIPSAGQTFVGERYEYQPGGRGVYSAITLEELGAESIFCARLGGDSHSARLKAFLENRGLDARFVTADRQSQTGLVAVISEPNIAKRNIIYPGANQRLNTENVEEAFTSYPDGLITQLDIPTAPIIAAVSFASIQGVPAIFDAVYTPGAADGSFPLEQLDELDVLITDESSVFAFTSITPADQERCMRACLALAQRVTTKYTVLRLGSRGIFLYDGTYFKIIAPYEVPMTDTAASGDAFAASLSLEYIRSRDIGRACEFANIVSTIVSSRPGALSSIPKLDDVSEFIAENGLGFKL
jgi:ribokinase